MTRLNLGIVGVGGRGQSFKAICERLPNVTIHAVCDTDPQQLAAAAATLAAAEQYQAYEQMLARSAIDAVIIGTPMPLHASQSIQALEAGVHVYCEVTAAVSIAECQQLTRSAASSERHYMLAENYIYRRPNVIIQQIVDAGLFGQLYYAEAEYIHELKDLNEETPWRRHWQTGIDGITYGTHSLGPILRWLGDDRVVAVSCSGAGHHHRDARGERYENQSSCVMLCRLQSGGLVKIRVDMLSDRPHAMANYQLQGRDGAYESARAPGEIHRIWLRSKSPESNQWQDLEQYAQAFLPTAWQAHKRQALGTSHDGADYYALLDFVTAIKEHRPGSIGIHEAMDMTLPGLCSQQSIREGGIWIQVPDSRAWV